MKTTYTVYVIALALWKEHTRGKKEPESFSKAEIDKWIFRISGDDPRTYLKYEVLLEREGYITPIDEESWIIENEPQKPKTPTEWVASLKKLSFTKTSDLEL